jgi:hypothetical protein
MALSLLSLASFWLAGAWRGPPRCVVMVLVSVVALCLAGWLERGVHRVSFPRLGKNVGAESVALLC